MYLWTWQAGRHSGVTDDPATAVTHAASHLAEDVTATVRKVRPELGFHTLSDFYVPTPVTWTGRLVNGLPEWSEGQK
jgi:hypothetical protein